MEDVRLDHLVRYRWAAERILERDWPFTGLWVADIGCGAGYGTRFIRDKLLAATIPGEDGEEYRFSQNFVGGLDKADAVAYAEKHYAALGLAFGEGTWPSLAEGKPEVDSTDPNVIVAVEVLEHIYDDVGFLAWAADVLRRSDGLLLLTTPNAATRGDGSDDPFHVRHYTTEVLLERVRLYFNEVELWYQHSNGIAKAGSTRLFMAETAHGICVGAGGPL